MARQMKDSGVEWIGEIPEEWKLKRLSSLFEDVNKKVSDKDFRPLSVTKQGILPQIEGVAKTDNGDNRKLVQKGNFVINSRSDRKGSSGVSEYEGSVSLINIVFRAKSEVSMQYMHHLLRSYGFQEEFYRWGYGIVADLWTTNSTDARNILLPYPKIEEQSLIATTLTSKCAEIDKVVEQTRATIEEYKKLKQTIITEAVTKGVRGSRPMKPSGVEWIGDIPEEWSKDKIGRVCNLIGSGTTPKFDRFDLSSADIPWIQSGDLSSTHLHNVKTYVTRDIIDAHSALKVYEPPFIAVAMYGASIGNTSISSFSACVNQACCVLTPGTFNLSYLYYIIMACKPYFMYQGEGGGQPNISQEKIKQTWIPVPNPIEQQEIAAYLDTKCAEIDRIIEKKEQLIEELGSYKKSLIYEYVTGKKEVTA